MRPNLPLSVCPLPFLVLCLTALPTPGACQVIRGVVLSSESRSPIGAATVRLFDLETYRSSTRVTGSDGSFLFSPPPGRVNRLEVSALGYLTHIDTVYAEPQGDSLDLEVRLGVDAIPLEPLVVVGSKRPVWESTQPKFLWEYFERQELYGRLGTGSRFYDRASLDSRVGQIGSLARLEFLWPLLSANRTFIGCAGTNLFVDGFFWRGEEDPLKTLPWNVGDLAGVEVYYGVGVPGEFITGPVPPCRVMALWTRKSVIPEETREDEPNPYLFLPVIGLVALLFGF